MKPKELAKLIGPTFAVMSASERVTATRQRRYSRARRSIKKPRQ